MIDYRSHIVALNRLKFDLGKALFSNPAVAADRDKQLAEVSQEPGMAALGSLIDHLLRHAASDGQELALLERAAGLWKEGVDLYASLGNSRSNIESALLDPTNPDSAGHFNNAIENIRLLGLKASGKLDAIDALRQDVMKLSHIPEHPRQANLQLSDWGWGDVFLARRTDAFVRTAYHDARKKQDPALCSFAFGVLSSYSANLCGSAYLVQVVGGPRRSHRFRNRVASNAVGSWFAAQTNPEVKSVASIADLIRSVADPAAPALPAPVESFIKDSLQKTYNLGRTAPLPDLQTGYSRLVRHLELLDTFYLPSPPPEPALPFRISLYGDSSNPPTPLFTLKASNFASGPGQGSGSSHPTNYSGFGKMPTTTNSAPTIGERCGSFWMGIMYAVMFLGGGFAPCIGQWGKGQRCKLWDAIWEEFGDANKPTQAQMEALASQSYPLTAAEFPAVAEVDQMTKMVGYMFDLQCQLWEGLGKVQAFLAIYGMIYPDDMLYNPVYEQFLTVPTAATLPRQPELDPVPNFYRYPPTEVEKPPCGSAPYPTGAKPNIFIGPPPQEQNVPPVPTASSAAMPIWSQIVIGALDTINYDLDGDRGFQFQCWSTHGLIESDHPVDVQILAYGDM
jgi:hypothetical protein